MHRHIDFHSRRDFMDMVLSDAGMMSIMYHVIRQDRMSNDEKLMLILDDLHAHQGIAVILGKPGSGKTCLEHFLGEQLNQQFNEKVWWFGPPAELPSYIGGSTLVIDKLPVNATILCDEASVQASARGSRSEVISTIATQRHSDRTWIYSSQLASLADVNITRLARGAFFLTPATFSSPRMERKEFFMLGSELKMLIPAHKGSCLYIDNDKILIFDFDLPSWWTDKFSKPYRKFEGKAQAYRAIFKLMDDGLEFDDVKKQLSMRETSIDDSKLRIIMANYRKDSSIALFGDKYLVDIIDAGMDDTPINEVVKRLLKGVFEPSKEPVHYDFELKPTQAAWFDMMRQQSSTFNMACGTPWNQDMAKEIIGTVKGNSNCIIHCSGWTGTGKSLTMLSIAMLIYYIHNKKELLPEQVKDVMFFDRELLMNRTKQLLLQKDKGRNSVLVEDEAGQEDIGIGSRRPMEEMGNLLQTIRQRQLHFIFCSPKERLYTQPFEHFEAMMYGKDEQRGVSRALIKKDAFYYGYITVARPSSKHVKAYNELKEAFLDKVQGREGSSKNYREIAEELMDEALVEQARSKSELMAVLKQLKPNMNTSELGAVADWVRMIRRQEE